VPVLQAQARGGHTRARVEGDRERPQAGIPAPPPGC
jgi:hypothetical protein